MFTLSIKRSKKAFCREGAALIELSICLPVFFLITMATIETCRMIYLRQSLKIAAYEGARLAIVPGATRQDVMELCDLILIGRNINGHQFSCIPSDPATLTYSDLFKVTIEISAENNSIVGTWFYRNKILTESVTIMAEH